MITEQKEILPDMSLTKSMKCACDSAMLTVFSRFGGRRQGLPLEARLVAVIASKRTPCKKEDDDPWGHAC